MKCYYSEIQEVSLELTITYWNNLTDLFDSYVTTHRPT